MESKAECPPARPKPNARAWSKAENPSDVDRVAAQLVARHWAGRIPDIPIWDTVIREIGEHALSLAGPDPSPMVMTLAVTAALCWARLRDLEKREDLWRERLTEGESGRSPRQVALDNQLLNQAHRRYVRTLEALARVRTLEARAAGGPTARAKVVDITPAVGVASPLAVEGAREP